MDNILLTIIVPVYNYPEVDKALDSIPQRSDIEILIVDDGSTDETPNVINKWIFSHLSQNVRVIRHGWNMGLGAAKNTGFDNAKGMYVTQLDSDDYLYTNEYNKVINRLDGTDIVYIDMQVNDGLVFAIDESSRRGFCSGCARLIRRDFLGDIRCPEIQAGEDWYLSEELLKKNPTEKFTRVVAYHYNYPREGSLFDKLVKGEIK
jgi:glycosyltransferase involved in cell wall biosynthesis